MTRTYELSTSSAGRARAAGRPICTTQVDEIVAAHGRHHREDRESRLPRGRRKLAYEIGHHKEGIYVLEVINGGGELVKEIDRRLKVTEGLLRHLIVRVDEHQIKAERARNKRTEESRRRRVARGLAARSAAR